MINKLNTEKFNKHLIDTSLGRYHQVAARLIQKYTPPGGKVIDIGCGVGQLLYLVEQMAPILDLYGSDISEYYLHETKKQLSKVNTILMRDETFNVQSLGKGYDTCVMLHSLEHMRCPLEVLSQVMSIIKPGGYLILAVPNLATPKIVWRNILRIHYVNKGHVYGWDRSHWINFLENIAKLNVIEYPTDEIRIIPHHLLKLLGFLKPIDLFGARLFPWLSSSNMAVIKKTHE